MKHRVLAILLAATMCVASVTGCGKQSADNSSAAGTEAEDNSAAETADTQTDNKDLREVNVVLDWYPNAIHSFLYVAQEKGYFADEGLNLVINFPANTNDGISMPAAGKADIGIYYLQDAIQTAVEENVPIVSVGAVTQSSLNVVISLAKSGIKGAEDLAGKKIGYSGTALSEAQIASMLKNVGLSADDCQFVDVGFDL